MAKSLALVSAAGLSLLLTGCSTNFDQTEVSPGQSSLGTIRGVVHGGQSAIVGAHVYVFGTSITGYGGNGIAASTGNASTSLLTTGDGSDANGHYVLSGTSGTFTVTGDYTCTLGQVVYIYSVGGNPGLAGGTNNTGSGEMAILGVCPSNGGNLASAVPFVFVNEVTTVAAAYALAGFATDATHIGDSGSLLALTGITNAANTAANMVNIATGAPSATPLKSGATGTVPLQEINTLSNIIGSCVNTTGSTSTQCTSLFRNATSDGVECATTCATEPSDSATAAIYIAHHSGQSSSSATDNNVHNLYALQSGFSLFAPPLSAQPTDFSMQISFTGGGLKAEYNDRGLAIDNAGNLYVVNSQGTTLNTNGNSISKFSNLGVPANSTGYTSLGLDLPVTIVVNAASTDAWITSYNNDTIVDFNIAGGTGTAHTVTTGFGPADMTIDASGNIWAVAANNVDSSPSVANRIVKMTTGGTATYSSNTNGLDDPYAIAATSGVNGYIWVSNAAGSSLVSLFGQGSSTNKTVTTHPNQAPTVSIDSAGKAWFATSSDIPSVWSVPAGGGTATGYTLPGAPGSFIPANVLDGAGNSWVTGSNSGNGTVNNPVNKIWGINSSGTSLTGVSAYFPQPQPANPATTEGTEPNSIAVDGSGNVWYTSTSDATLHEIVGAGVPVVTPIAAGVANGTLATRP